MTLVELRKKFWSKVDIKGPDECWNYKYGKTPDGYGQFWINGKGGVRAHRFAWMSYYDREIPKERYILHKCDNPSCCNPKHLYRGTQADNGKDMVIRNRVKSCGKGKYSAEEIMAIRKLKSSGYSRTYIAKLLSVQRWLVGKIWSSDKYLCKEGYYLKFKGGIYESS